VAARGQSPRATATGRSAGARPIFDAAGLLRTHLVMWGLVVTGCAPMGTNNLLRPFIWLLHGMQNTLHADKHEQRVLKQPHDGRSHPVILLLPLLLLQQPSIDRRRGGQLTSVAIRQHKHRPDVASSAAGCSCTVSCDGRRAMQPRW